LKATPWSEPAWTAAAEAWIAKELGTLGRALSGPVVEVKKGSISCVLRAPTQEGAVYFKVASKLPLFVNEAAVTLGLSEFFPGLTPKPLAVDLDAGWLLLPDFGALIGWDASVVERSAAMQAFARLQLSSVDRSRELLRMGCMDRRLPVLKAQVDPWLETLNRYAALEAGEFKILRSLAPRLKARCDEVGDFGLPDTLVHGDMHMGNVARSSQGGLFFDWTDACVGHPFMDLLNVHQEKDEAAREALLQAYLGPWEPLVPRTRLESLWTLTGPLCALHQAISYQHIVIDGFEGAREQFANEILFWPRKLLELMDGA
jgi:hypothetical protein